MPDQFQKTGIEAEVRSLSRFLNSIARINNAYSQMGSAADSGSKKAVIAANNQATATIHAMTAVATAQSQAATAQANSAAIQARSAAAVEVATKRVEVAATKAASSAVTANLKLQTEQQKTAQVTQKAAAIQEKAQKNLEAQTIRSAAAVQASANNITIATIRSNTQIANSQHELQQEQQKTAQAQLKNQSDLAKSDARVIEANARSVDTQLKTDAKIIESNNRVKIAAEQTAKAQIQADEAVQVGKMALLKTVLAVASGMTAAIALFAASVIKKLADVVSKVVSVGVELGRVGFNLAKSLISALNPLNLLHRASDEAGGSLKNLGQILTSPLSTGAYLAINAIKSLIGWLKNASGSVIEAVATFQRLRIQFVSLAQRDISKALGISFTDALHQATFAAQDLELWIKKLAVLSPFTSIDIATSLALANAYGLNIKMAKDLTFATGEFTAGMGLTAEHMQRIIYNFGQMQNQGKLTGREFRDLAISFVPVFDILAEMAKEAGITTEAMKELAFSGGVPVTAFFEKFIQMAERDFPGAMEKMSRTWEGVTSNIQEFIQTVLGTSVLGPTFDFITGKMADMLKALLSEENLTTAQHFGIAIKEAFITASEGVDAVIDALKNFVKALGFGDLSALKFMTIIVKIGVVLNFIGRQFASFINTYVVPFVNNLRDRLSRHLTGTANNALTWGANIVINLAKGMIEGVSAALQKAIEFIGGFISYWLGAHSAPRILPDLFEWGAAAIAEYMRGFTEVDFSALDSIQRALEGALGAITNLGLISKEAAQDLFVGISEDLIKGIEEFERTGQITSNLFEQLSNVAGGFGEELARLLQDQLDLVAATNALTAAQEAYNAAVKAATTARRNANKFVKEYNALLRAGADKRTLDAKLKELQAQELVADAAQQAANIADQQVKDAQDALDPIKERVSLQEKLIAQLIELAKAQAEAQGGGGGGTEPPPEEGPPFELPPMPVGGGLGDDFEEAIKNLKKRLQDQLAHIWDDIVAAWHDAIDPALETLREKWHAFTGVLKSLWDAFAAKFGLPTADEILAVWSDFDGTWASFLTNLAETWDLFALKLGLPTVDEIMAAWDDFDGTWAGVIKGLQNTWDVFAEKLDLPTVDEIMKVWADFDGSFGSLVDNLAQTWDLFAEKLDLPKVEPTLKKIEMALRAIVFIGAAVVFTAQAVADTIGQLSGNADKGSEKLSSFENVLRLIIVAATSVVFFIGAIASGLAGAFLGAITPIQEGVRLITEGIELIQKGWEKFLSGEGGIGELVHGVFDTIAGFITLTLGTIIGVIGGFVTGVIGFFQNLYNRLVGASIVIDMMNLIESTFTDVLGRVSTFVETTLETIKGFFRDKLEDAKVFVSTKAGEIETSFTTFQTNVQTAWDTFWGNVHTTVTTKVGEIQTSIDTFQTNVQTKWDTFWGDVHKTVDTTITNIKTSWDNAKQDIHDKIVAPVQEAWDSIGKIDFAQLAKDLIGFFQKEWENAKQTIIDVVVAPAQEAWDTISRIDFFQLASDIVQGLIDGIQAKIQALRDKVSEMWAALKGQSEEDMETNSPSKVMMRYGFDVMDGLIMGIEDSTPDLYNAMDTALGGLIDLTDRSFKEILDIGSALGGVGQSIINRYRDQYIDPLEATIGVLDKQIADTKHLLDANKNDIDSQIYYGKILADLENERAETADELAEKQEKILHLQEQQAKLDFLKQQFQLIDLIDKYHLDSASILGGLTLGLDASLDDLLAAMTEAMTQVVQQAAGTLGIGSPSKVFEKIGQNVIKGFSKGVEYESPTMNTTVSRAMNNVIVPAQRVSAPMMATQNSISFGDMYVSNEMDAGVLRATIRDEVKRFFRGQ